MSRPRLLLVLTEFPPSFGGMQTHAIYLCRHLQERGYPIAVATYRHDGGPAFDSTLPFPVYRCLSRIGYWHNVRALTSLAADFRPDLIYSSTVFYGQVRDHTGVPFICRSAGNDVQRPWIAWPFPWLTDAVSRPWFEDMVYGRFRRLDWPERVEAMLLRQRREAMLYSAGNMSRVMANSAYTAGLLELIGVESGRVLVLPGGVDAARFYPAFQDRKGLRRELGLPARKYLLLTACRLVAKKGIDLLLGALPAIRERMPDVHLVVVGEGRDRAKCERLAASLGLRHAVTFTGYVPHADLHRYYWSADQFVLASREHLDLRTGLRDVETMGRVLCEANAAGVPAVASRSGGIPSVIAHGSNGLLFEEGRADQLIETVDLVRHDSALRSRLREAGLRAAAKVFDWSVICDAHEREFAAASDRVGNATLVLP